jgi:hypothetical protein
MRQPRMKPADRDRATASFSQSYHLAADRRSHLETRPVSSLAYRRVLDATVCLVMGDRHAKKASREAPPFAGDSPRRV